MLSRADVHALAVRHVPADRVPDAVDAVRPAWRLEPATRHPHGGSQAPPVTIGGPAPLATGEAWPTTDAGRPLTFVATVRSALLPDLAVAWTPVQPWGHAGETLRIFADLSDPSAPVPAVVLAAAGDVILGPTDAPTDRDAATPTIDEVSLHVAPFLTVPEGLLGSTVDAADEELAGAGEAFAHDLRRGGAFVDIAALIGGVADELPWEISHLLGHPCSLRRDVREAGGRVHEHRTDLQDEDRWATLLAVHGGLDVRLRALHGGSLTILVPFDELAAGRYDHAVCTVEPA